MVGAGENSVSSHSTDHLDTSLPDQAQTITPDDAASKQTAGQMLREAKVNQGLSVEDVAKSLNLKPAQIVAIEAQDVSQLPGMVFMRGFMRNYAKKMGLDVDSVMAAVCQDASPAELSLPAGLGARANPVSVRVFGASFFRILMFFAIFLALAGAVVVYLRGVPFVVDQMQSVKNIFFASQADEKTLKDEGSSAILAQPSLEVQGTSVNKDVLVNEPLQPAKVVENASGIAPLQGSAVVGNSPELKLNFKGKAWVEVKDVTGVIIFSGEGKAGVVQNVSGKPPLALVIGNAKDVSLEYQGKGVDLAPFTRGTVARLNLPPS